MSPAELRIRCRMAESCLPEAEYRKRLTELHDVMLSIIERAVHGSPTSHCSDIISDGGMDPKNRPDATPPAPAQPLTKQEIVAVEHELNPLYVDVPMNFMDNFANACIDAFCAKNGITKGN